VEAYARLRRLAITINANLADQLSYNSLSYNSLPHERLFLALPKRNNQLITIKFIIALSVRGKCQLRVTCIGSISRI
jgi:hypothetical protein